MIAWKGWLRDEAVKRPRTPLWWGAALPRPTVEDLRDIWLRRRAQFSSGAADS